MTLHEFCTPFGQKRSEYADEQPVGTVVEVLLSVSKEGLVENLEEVGLDDRAEWPEAEGRTVLQVPY